MRWTRPLVCAPLISLLSVMVLAKPPDSRQVQPIKRIVIFEIDGLGADHLYHTMQEIDPATGKSRLPWFSRIFAENGTVFENFYTRGISLSAPSWSMLDSGHHTVIRGNVEYDRFTGQIYDYLNFFPFYLGYARKKEVDMPGVTVLSRAGIPLLVDSFRSDQRFQSFQLFQEGVRWTTLRNTLARRISSKTLFAAIETGTSPSLSGLLAEQTEAELLAHIGNPDIAYLDFFTGEIDHDAHASNAPAALLSAMKAADALAGRIWTAIEASPLAHQTLFVTVSDHGMNNVPDVHSQAFSLPDFFNSEAGGTHHVLTNRPQLSDYKIRGLDPLVQRVITSSTASFYLKNEADHYPTAWLDLDGNERAAVHLRNSDLNKIQILLQELAKQDLPPSIRKAAAWYLRDIIESHRAIWTQRLQAMTDELSALHNAIEARKQQLAAEPDRFTHAQWEQGEDKHILRLRTQYEDWQTEYAAYSNYLLHLRALLSFEPDERKPFHGRVAELVPEMMLGDSNTAWDLRHYVVGPAAFGLVLRPDGRLDEQRSFRYCDYPALLSAQRVRNNPQPALSSQPVDFMAMRLVGFVPRDAPDAVNAYWLYGSEDKQLLILTDGLGRIQVRPVCIEMPDFKTMRLASTSWKPGLPLHLFEDPDLHLPPGEDRAAWLSAWHSEREWFEAIHLCHYSNAVIGIVEELSPVGDQVLSAWPRNPVMLEYEKRRRELVQPDFDVFAADHWNFNVRNFNPGGNHGSFFRISTHSVWMMAGPGIPAQQITEPYDSLNFASTVFNLLGKKPPMPDRVIPVREPN
ncbi:MAG: alkaline phosphatase family protein [Acidobacteriaceae bacterium]|nr:alkaline phosphatase family protein [Acidobacteriaceae bacterium]